MDLLTFTLLPPKSHALSHEKLRAMKNHFEKSGRLYGPLTSKATYILFEGQEYGILGSACLLPPSILQASRKAFSHQEFQTPSYWECSKIFFSPPKNFYQKERPESIALLKAHFYEGLYYYLEEMVAQKDVPQLVTFNPPAIHEDTKFLGNWPFEAELEVSIPSFKEKGYILGILPLLTPRSLKTPDSLPH